MSLRSQKVSSIVCLLLAVCLMLCALPMYAAADDNIASDSPTVIDGHSGSCSPKQITSDYCIHLNLGAPFEVLTAVMPTWSTSDSAATLALYHWDSDYSTTIHSEPIALKRFDPLVDCAENKLEFDEQPAGEYLFRIYEIRGTVGLMTSGSNVSDAICYEDGKESKCDWWMNVYFTKTPKTPFLHVKSLLEDVDGSHTAPEPYVYPDDSLVVTHNVMPDTWVFTDGLGRTSLTYDDVGAPKPDKNVAMFYWTWHGGGAKPLNVTDFMEKHPEAKNDFYNPAWPSGSVSYFWNEPIWGYYLTTDEWVLRRQAELLANAGVDTIFTDNTNGGFTWKQSYDVLYPTWDKAQKEGAVNTPKISFHLPFYPFNESYDQIVSLYMDIYRPGKYQNLWYYLDGKPMLLACDDHSAQQDTPIKKETYRFFTWRRPCIASNKKDITNDMWGWLSGTPQPSFYGSTANRRAKQIEQITVGVSRNYDYINDAGTAMNGENVTGRSYTTSGYHTEENASLYGYFFAEQFDYALTVDPKVIFVTGWNEWTAGRQEEWGGVKNAFADEFTDEYSRDIEPSRGALQDHYYYELVNYVRRFKGVRPIPTPSEMLTVDMTAGSAQWSAVEPYYAAYIGNTEDRDHDGYGSLHYTDKSGRNDLIGAQLERDGDYIWFRAECAADITPYTDSLWMNLYIDSDQTSQGWNTFDFVINKSPASADTVVLERFTKENDYGATEKVTDCAYTVDGNAIVIRVPKSALGLEGFDWTINFAWTDNVHDQNSTKTFSGDILDFYTSGDVAPGGRFKFSYVSTVDNAGYVETVPDTETVTDPVTVTDSPETDAPASGCRSVVLAAPLALCLLGAWCAWSKRRNTFNT